MGEEQFGPEGMGSTARPLLQHPLVAMLVAVLVYIFAAAFGIAFGSAVTAGQPATGIVQTAINVGLTLIAYKLVVTHLGANPRDDLPAADAVANLGKGLVAGALLFSAIVAAAGLLGIYRIVGEGHWRELVLPLFVTAVAPGFMEEVLFRGIFFRWIEEWGGSWAALVVTSALFGIAHILNPGATLFSSFAIAVEAGVLLGGAYMLTRSLWMPIGLHAAWNFTQGAIFGVPVSGIPTAGIFKGKLSGPQILSGGRFGLEASVIALLIATASGAWFVRLALRRGELVRPSWVRRASAC
ncbi:MAG TPA: CPBP family intramembrane glutamic endopeptidase [Sphingomicrobium sp.]|nr:CPBP family intramembrane glutamic endopeptidase [Sphingomicrobium sp.]